jgi:hypothetical protein
MHPETVEGLLEEGVLAESGLSSKATAAVGASEQARWQGHGVYEREGGVVRSQREQFLPNALLYLPEVCSLPAEGGAVDLSEGGEPFTVVSAEEQMDGLVSVSMPRNSPTISMVRTSSSESLGAGPRLLMHRSLSRSSMRQKTATIKVL